MEEEKMKIKSRTRLVALLLMVEKLSEHYEIPTISTGVILRTNIKEETELGKLASQYINDGKLVPDEVMIELMEKRLGEPDCKNGFILDGFPRTVPQMATIFFLIYLFYSFFF